jgi:cullin-associated NEDD8-dissociated protein 1
LFGTSNLRQFTFQDLESQMIDHFQSHFTSQQQGSSAAPTTSLNLKQSLTNLALCIASICLTSSVEIQHQTIMKYVSVIEKTVSTTTSLDNLHHLATNKYFSFLCLGFIGQHLDIRPVLNSKSINLDVILFNSLSSDSDDMKSLISHTLGYLSIGNLSYYVPLVMQELNRTPPYQYYLLMALREVFLIAVKDKLNLDAYISDIVQNLFQFLSSEEENVRNILAECLGSLMVLYPVRLIDLLNQTILAKNIDNSATLTLTNSMKFFFSRYVSGGAVDLPSFAPMVDLLTSEDIEILKSTIQMVNSAVHYNVSLIRDSLTPFVIGKIIEVLGKKAERVIDLGPFKHRVSFWL